MNESRSACRGTDSTHDLQVCQNFCLSQGRAKQKPSKDWSAHTSKHGVNRTGTCGEEGMMVPRTWKAQSVRNFQDLIWKDNKSEGSFSSADLHLQIQGDGLRLWSVVNSIRHPMG